VVTYDNDLILYTVIALPDSLLELYTNKLQNVVLFLKSTD